MHLKFLLLHVHKTDLCSSNGSQSNFGIIYVLFLQVVYQFVINIEDIQRLEAILCRSNNKATLSQI